MAPKLNHPFLEGLKGIPEGKRKDLQKIKSWMNAQSHLPQISDEYVYLFLHACYYSQDKTKSAIENYFTIRASHPAIFADRDAYSPKMKAVLDMGLRPANRTAFYKNSYQGQHQYSTYLSFYQLHPEKLKQIIKERDGQNLCSYYDSDIFKKQAQEVLEEQTRVINEGTPLNLNDCDISYEHMINCAQPRYKPKVFIVQKKKREENFLADISRQKSFKKLAKPGQIKNKKEPEEKGLPVKQAQIVYAPDPTVKKEGMTIKDRRRQYRKRTTIMPLYLKKIQQNIEKREREKGGQTSDISAQKFTNVDGIDYDNQLLNTRQIIYVTKSEYKDEDKEKLKHSQMKLKEKILNVDYENETFAKTHYKHKPKYGEGYEEGRHQKSKGVKKSKSINREVAKEL